MSNSRTVRVISEYIHHHACQYFPSLDSKTVEVRLVEEQQRPFSALYRFEVFDDHERYHVFAKGTPTSDSGKKDDPTLVQRPRLAPPLTEYGERQWLEFTALRAIHNHFEKLGKSGFGSINVLDFIRDEQTILMEENRDPNLLSLFSKTTRLSPPFRTRPDLHRMFFNAGAWLKAYSTLEKTDDVKQRNTRRDDYNDSISSFSNYLSRIIGYKPFFDEVAETAINIAIQSIPSELPLGMGHGDYAMRNILIGKNNRITVIDTSAKWRIPIYEDIAYFLIRLETNKLQTFTQGLAISPKSLASYQSDFLAGYFDQSPVPEKIISLFKIQSLLDNWSSRASGLTQPSTLRKSIYQKAHLALLNRHYQRVMLRLLQDIR